MVFVDENLCIGCALCVPFCKRGAIEVFGTARIDKEKCSNCLACIDYCVNGAIKKEEKKL